MLMLQTVFSVTVMLKSTDDSGTVVTHLSRPPWKKLNISEEIMWKASKNKKESPPQADFFFALPTHLSRPPS